jgi:hypothetical protein
MASKTKDMTLEDAIGLASRSGVKGSTASPVFVTSDNQVYPGANVDQLKKRCVKEHLALFDVTNRKTIHQPKTKPNEE